LVLNIPLAGREMDVVVTLPFVSEVSSSVVSRRSMKRFFDLETKRRVVAEFDALEPYSAERGSLLRREGIVRRQIDEWRKTVAMKSSDSPKRGPGRPPKQPGTAELERLRARNVKLEAELAKKEKVIEILGKAHALLEAIAESADTEPKS
jgi:transposase